MKRARKKSKSYRYGALSAIARQEGVTAQAIWNAVYLHHNPRITQLVADWINDRKITAMQAQKSLQNALR